MIDKEKRDEVWERNKPYMDPDCIEETAEDLLPMCKECKLYKGPEHDFEGCRGKVCFELWLSNEYLEWSESWNYE